MLSAYRLEVPANECSAYRLKVPPKEFSPGLLPRCMKCQVQAIGWSLYGFKRRYLGCRVGRPRKEKISVEERAPGRGLGDIVNTQRDVREAGSGRGRGKGQT